MLQAIAKVGHDLSSQRSGHKHFTALRTGDGTATRHAATLTLTKLESPGRRNSRSCRPCGTVACPVAAALATDAGGCCSVGGGADLIRPWESPRARRGRERRVCDSADTAV